MGRRAISNILNAIKSVIKSIWDGIKSIISSVLNGIKNTVSSIFNGIKTVISSVLNTIKTVVSSVWNGIKGAISGAVSGIKTTVTTGFKEVKSKVINAFTELPGKLKSIGKNLVEGLWNGINNAKDWVLGKIKGFGKGILNGLKDFFGIKSPSRVMRDEVGRMLVEGVAEGITENKDNAKKSAEELGALILESAQKKLDNSKTYNDLTLADEVAFWNGMRQRITEGTQARTDADKKYFDAKKSLNDELLKAEQKLQADIEVEYQKIEDRTRDLMNLTSYDEALSFEDMEKNLTRETKKIEQWGAAIDVLEQKIGGSQLLKDILSSGMGGALNKAYELAFNVSDDELERYTRLYDEKFSKANLQATKELAGEVSEGITKAQTEFYTTCQTLGVDISEEFNGKMSGMITSITDALSGIKTAFETFEPKMKLPHFKVEGKFDLENGTVPTAAVEWYAKAMQSPMLLNKPTIFGYNPSTGNYMGAGDAGAEIVGGASSLMSMMKNAVAEQNSALVVVLSKILDAILMLDANMGGNLREALEGMGLDVNHREFARLVKAVN